MFIPTTPGGDLKARLQRMETNTPFRNRCKYVEQAGPTILSKLFSPDPWKTHCGRDDCIICKSEPGKCTQKTIIYDIECKLCLEENKSSRYIGESSRTAYERAV